MKMVDLFATQLEREAAISRRLLERVPEGRPDWKPHEKSMPLGYLSMLVATMPSWIALAIVQDSLDLGSPASKQATVDTTKELLAAHEAAYTKGRDALRGTSDEFLMTNWRLLVGARPSWKTRGTSSSPTRSRTWLTIAASSPSICGSTARRCPPSTGPPPTRRPSRSRRYRGSAGPWS